MLVKKICKPFIAFVTLFILMSNARQVMLFVKSALLICYNNIIPSLYVFMILSAYISQADFLPFLSLPMSMFSSLMKIKDKKYSAYLILSLIGGFVIGAQFLKKLEEQGYEQNCLMAISPSLINNSLSFCVFAVGIGFLENYYLGIMLFASLTAASLITSFILSFLYTYSAVIPSSKEEVFSVSFVECVNNAVKSILSICGFVIIFYCVCEVILLYIPSDTVKTVISVFTEITVGCAKIFEIMGKNAYAACFALSIMPLSTICQVYYFTGNKNIVIVLILSRAIHTPVSVIIFSLLINIFPVAATVINPRTVAVRNFSNTMEISATMFLITLCFILIFDGSKLFTKK